MKKIIFLISFLSFSISDAQTWVNDNTFDVGTGFNDQVEDVYMFSDNKILCVGRFTTYKGTTVNRIVKLNTDGSIDASFNPGTGTTTGNIYSVAVQSDGKILIGGSFSNFNGVTRNKYARLNADGSTDTSYSNAFVPNTGITEIWDIAFQSDGKAVVTGSLTDQYRTVARFNTDGTLDTTYDAPDNLQYKVIKVAGDDKVYIAGNCNACAGNGLTRLNATTGAIDTSFNTGSGFNGVVHTFFIQSDGKIVVGGNFTTYNGIAVGKLIRLNTDGSIDGTFTQGPINRIYKIDQTPDGKILVSGEFTNYGGLTRNYFARINSDGTIDTTFDLGNAFPGFQIVNNFNVQSDGRIIIAGGFGFFNETKNRIVRIIDSALSSESFNFSTNVISYPNPIINELFFESSSTGIVAIYDVNGKFILSQNLTIGTIKINCENLLSGIYLAKVTNDKNEIKTIKLIKE